MAPAPRLSGVGRRLGVTAAKRHLRAAAPQSGRLVLPAPTQKTLSADVHQAGIVLVPGMGIKASAYRPLLAAMQQRAATQGVALFAGCVGLDWFKEPLRQPEDLKPHIDSVLTAFAGQGLLANGSVFHAAHSLGTVFLQDYLAQGRQTLGQILLGGCLLRKHCLPAFSYRVPTLTIGASMDSQEPITRQAEQYRLQANADETRFPLVVLEGQTHMQFASGSRPECMKQEIPAAVRDTAAHAAAADVAIDFMAMRLGLPGAGRQLQVQIRSTREQLLPLLFAQEHLQTQLHQW